MGSIEHIYIAAEKRWQAEAVMRTQHVLRPGNFAFTVLIALILLTSGNLSARENEPYLYILGVAQDAGYPQAGCFAAHCLPGWENPALRRGATSIAIVDPGAEKNWLFEATPHMPAQLYDLRQEADLPLGGVFLTHAHIGHYAGLMFFGREAMGTSDVPVYAMPRMTNFLSTNGPWSQLVELNNIQLFPISEQRPMIDNGITVTPFLVPHRDEYSETVGYHIRGPSRTAIFIPDINKWQDWDVDIAELVLTVDYALLDATFYADGELGNRDMSQIPHPFVSESMELFSEFTPGQRNKVWFIHFNHTNPLLNPESEESRFVIEEGYNIAREGVRLSL